MEQFPAPQPRLNRPYRFIRLSSVVVPRTPFRRPAASSASIRLNVSLYLITSPSFPLPL
jgi:hypothetical protein